MSGLVVVGAQWGDEGKGKVVDIYAERADLIVRYQGGNNAGHTLVVDTPAGPRKTILHLIPSGILYANKVNVIATGVTLDVDVLFRELDGLAAQGRQVSPGQLVVSQDAHVTMPYHCAIDVAREAARASEKIGTTGRGIGPSYEDRAARRGVRVRDLLDGARLSTALRHVLPEKNAVLESYGAPRVDEESLFADMLARGARLRPFVGDVVALLADAGAAGKRILFEGAQGTLLDIGHGTYPFVTSSHTTTGGVSVGAGVPPASVSASVGVAKAYATRVGSGPFPTELLDDTGDRIRSVGHEFGSTTGRPRRCGWFDAVAMRTAQRLNGFTALAITKLDVLTGLDALRICVAYDTPHGRVQVADLDAIEMASCQPVYEEWPCWTEDLGGARSLADLPSAARRYLRRIEELSGVAIGLVSVGANRAQTIETSDSFAGGASVR